jgi:Lar family restriction alleviation protein
MGWNTTVVVLNDYLTQIEGDPAFGKNLVRAIRRLHYTGLEKPIAVQGGCAPRAAVVVETHDGYEEQGVIIGNNTGVLAEMELMRCKTVEPDEPLKECPFCGSDALLEEQEVHSGRIFAAKTYAVRCRGCAASGPWQKNPEGPVRAWNKREE